VKPARRIAGIVLLASAAAVFFATRVFVGFEGVRIKTVRQPTPAVDGQIALHLADDKFRALAIPVALVARIRNDSSAPQEIVFHVDGHRVCAATIPANAARRVDCAIKSGWPVQPDHDLSVAGARVPWTLDYLELATHHGHSTGYFQGLVLPADSHLFDRPSRFWIAFVWIALALLLLLEPRGFVSRAAGSVYALLLAAIAALAAIIVLSPVLSPYLVVISPATFVALALLATLSRTLPAVTPPVNVAASRVWTWCAVHHAPLAWTMAIAVAAFTGMYGTRAAGGSDEYGYASQAESWLNGSLKTEQPFVAHMPWPQAKWMFSPVGYRPHPSEPTVIVPVYAPGLPLVLAVVKLVGGQNSMFWVVPLSAGLLVLGTYFIGRRLGAETAGLVAALLVATSPVVLFMSTALMTDVPVATAWAWAFYLLLGPTIRSAAGAGLLSALAILIRPNLAPLAGVLAVYYLFAMRFPETRRRAVGQLIAFSLALVPGAAAIGLINAHLYGSPLSSGYGHWSDLFVLSRVPTNLRLYLGWFVQAHTPLALCGLFAVLIPLKPLWPDIRDRGVLVVMAAFVVGVWAMYCAWVVFDAWWYARFLLSTWPFVMLGIGSVAVAVCRSRARLGRPLVVVSVAALAAFQLDFAIDRDTFGARSNRRRSVAVARLVQRTTVPNSVILSVDHSGSIRYYGGRMTLMFGAIPDGSLDAVVEWLNAHGARPYLAVEEWEIGEFKERFAGSRCLRALDGPPLAMYENPGRMRLYDLAEPRLPGQATIMESDADIGATARPVPLRPTLVFTKVP
jgi:hypothetical protein